MSRLLTPLPLACVVLATALVCTACGDGRRGAGPGPAGAELARLVGAERAGLRLDDAEPDSPSALLYETLGPAAREAAARNEAPAERLVVDYPIAGSVFPPDLVAPTFLWHEPSERADAWYVEIAFASGGPPIALLVPGGRPPPGEIDERAIGRNNEIHRPTPYEASAYAWTPATAVWKEVTRRSVETPATVSFLGLSLENPDAILSLGRVEITTSKDEVGAPIFYRDVPLVPDTSDKGIIQPLARELLPLIAWRLRDLSKPESKVVLTGMPSCANCHSFSNDGRTLGMDVDGPQGDKGTYAIAPVEREMSIAREQVITWNSFPDKPAGHKTIGFLSRISPDGRFAATTVNESLYVANFPDYRFLQVFFPTRGILAWYSTETGEMRALPGADDPAFVHCSPVWTPDGKTIVFARAEAFDPYRAGVPLAVRPNDPNEPRIRYSLYRIPFAGGRGGVPEPIAGASHNGMSNTFPKVSPDGKWLVFTKCRNGLLMRPDSRLWIVPVEGGLAREMTCNTPLMNSWHSWSPNSRWLVFSSKANTPYTQMFLTHVDEAGNDTPPVLVPNSTAANRAVNLPEFVDADYGALDTIEVPAANHLRFFQRGADELRLQRLDAAIALLRKAVELEPDFSLAHANLGTALALKGELPAARRHLERALAIEARMSYAWISLGFVAGREGDHDEALEHFQRALEASPRSPYAHHHAGLALQELGRAERAERYYRRALELTPAYAEAHASLADLLARRGAVEEARHHWETVLELEPEDGPAHLALAWSLATEEQEGRRDGARALALAQRGAALVGRQDARALDVLGAALAENGRFVEAADSLRRALSTAGEDDPRRAGMRRRLALYESDAPYREPRTGR